MKSKTLFRLIAGITVIGAAIGTYLLDRETKYAQREPNPKIETNVDLLKWGNGGPYTMNICSRDSCYKATTIAYLIVGNSKEITNTNMPKYGNFFDNKQPKIFRIHPEDSVLCDSLESILNQALATGDTLILLGDGWYHKEKWMFLGLDAENMIVKQVHLKHAKKWVPDYHKYGDRRY